jgi:hypothetical protein
MDPSTINGGTFELRDGANVLVSAGVGYNAATGMATLTPTAALTPLSTYTATMRGGASDPRAKDAAGNPLAANRTWSFTTAAAAPVDTTAPTVTAVSPVEGATGVGRSANITATFSEAMSPATISTATFELRTAAGATVAATVSYSATNRRATLNPVASLGARVTYTVVVRGGSAGPRVTDAAGNALAADRVWTFTTR